MSRPRHILPMIVAAQFAGTSLWFVGNAALAGLAEKWSHVGGAVGWITSGVQLGFIAGTLVFGLLGVADRFAAHRVFFACSIAGALANGLALFAPGMFGWFLFTRVLAGIFLAGIYPVGMKLAASWFEEGLGAAIGWLVGALVLGTAFPHLLGGSGLDATTLIVSASVLALAGGISVLLAVPEGPAVEKARRVRLQDAWSIFGIEGYRRAAFGYFGHMWELYAFWAFTPFIVRLILPEAAPDLVAKYSFAAIAVGSASCVAGGWASKRVGSIAVARFMLGGSVVCGGLSPLMLSLPWTSFSLGFLIVWGAFAVADSPHFSSVAAQSVSPDRVGTALTLQNALGFALTIVSIQLLSALQAYLPGNWLFVALLPGPAIGIWVFRTRAARLH